MSPHSVGRRTQAERRDESGRSLLEAAIEVVADEGVSAATFETVGRRAGYSRGLATQRFGSKQGLIEAVIQHLHERQEQALAEYRIDELPGLEAVLAYVDLYLRGLGQQSETRAYFMLLSAQVADATELRASFAAEHARVERRLEGLVQKGQAEGAIRREIDADAAALMIGSLLLGLSMQVLVDPETDVDPIRETSLSTLRLSFGTEGRPNGPPNGPKGQS
ncbi:TetR/AcrR family transcriptional regulator [Phenylobacterium soli]|uniref:TetR/AcrR family transcriptional regulator n=1 Tax=Phenylobacterium soli TaxID=2170551 RepID=A0A328AR60_9CAUL|nr:TetR/AcrR family transcriptional regulator [Phenylobacterium soli]